MTGKPNDYKEQILSEIDCFLEKASDFSAREVPLRLQDAMRYALLGPGKRIRPLLLLLATELCGGDRRKALPAAAAVEMVHAYSLIHDDLPVMDNDDLRRGRATCHIQFDPATAILAGDAFQPYAFQILAEQIANQEIALRCIAELARNIGPFGLVGGQQEDISFCESLIPSDPSRLDPDLHRDLESRLLRIHSRKAGSLLSVSLKLGAFIADANPDSLKALDLFGKALGFAFQISDDILDATGNSKDLGKSPHKDRDQGKLTFITLWGLEKSQSFLYKYVDQACESLMIFDQDLPACQLLHSIALSMRDRKK